VSSYVEQHYFFNENVLSEPVRDVKDDLIEVENLLSQSEVNRTESILCRLAKKSRVASTV
jgi:hypothetical protein